MIILSKFDKDWIKTVASRVFTRFFYDLTYWPFVDPTWPIFELDEDIVKMIILSKFDDDWTKTVASRMFTSQNLMHDPQTHNDRQRPVKRKEYARQIEWIEKL